ncbi:MAG: band 7 protein, partial [Acidimicrobiales bacterium]|nr:band 7 protein [Acidimicrobiales bacterium]
MFAAVNAGAIIGIIVIVVVLFLVLSSVKTVAQGTVAVTTIFGKFHSVRRAGLSFLIPFAEKIFRRISIQNRAVELQFQAITQDQANVYFTAMMVYSVVAEDEATIKNVAFKFV